MVVTTAQLHSVKSELRFCDGPTCCKLVCNGKINWSDCKNGLKRFCQSIISQKLFVIIAIVIIIIIIIIIIIVIIKLIICIKKVVVLRKKPLKTNWDFNQHCNFHYFSWFYINSWTTSWCSLCDDRYLSNRYANPNNS